MNAPLPRRTRWGFLGRVPYGEALAMQLAAREAVKRGEGDERLLLLEHPHVYTLGRNAAPADVLASPEWLAARGIEVALCDRGGQVTYHGPGQLVGYPIVRLTNPIDVVNYVRRLEEALIAVCDEFGLTEAGRVDGRSGVWLPADGDRPERKIGAIGIRVARGVTMHGFALNCDCDLNAFTTIVPCGIADAGVTSLTAELGRTVAVGEVRAAVADAVCAALDGVLPVSDHPAARVASTT